MFYEVASPLSASLGRDLKRLLATDRSQAAMKSPEEHLRYALEIGEPTYQTIDQAPRNSFSGCVQPLGKQALLRVNEQQSATRQRAPRQPKKHLI